MLGEVERTGSVGMSQLFRMDPIVDGDPIGWTVRILAKDLAKMLDRGGYKDVADKMNLEKVQAVLPKVG